MWLTKHPYLQPVADLHARVEAAAAEICVRVAPVPDFAEYASDFHAGVPLLHSWKLSATLKTYDGEGSESVLLADWTSLHLDIIARERGLKRMAASLYHLGA